MGKIKLINQGDVISFKATDGNFKALICTSTYENKRNANFTFAALTYSNISAPTLNEILICNFFGIVNAKNDYFNYSGEELSKMWEVHPDIQPYILGSYGLIIWEKDFIKFGNNFEYIGNLDIVDTLDKNGNSSMNASNWEFLKDFFNEKFQSRLVERGQKQFSIKAIFVVDSK